MRAFFAAVILLSLSTMASASMVTINAKNGGYDNFSGTVTYSGTTLTIALDNTSTSVDHITGFVFNVDNGDTVTLTSNPQNNFYDLGSLGVSSRTASGFGAYDAGAAVGGDFQGAGNANLGIAKGITDTFTFNVTGAGASGLTASDFLTTSGPSGTDGAQFVVRFNGNACMACSDPSQNQSNPVPLPASSWIGLAALSLGGLFAKTRKARVLA
jgi:hypothetical protein